MQEQQRQTISPFDRLVKAAAVAAVSIEERGTSLHFGPNDLRGLRPTQASGAGFYHLSIDPVLFYRYKHLVHIALVMLTDVSLQLPVPYWDRIL